MATKMITDIFARRYASIEIRSQYFKEDQILCNQAWKIMSSGILWDSYITENISDRAEANFKEIHDILSLELGVEFLSDRYRLHTYEINGSKNVHTYTNKYAVICKNFLTKIPDDINKGDSWMKERFSLIELAFAQRARQIAEINLALPRNIAKAQIEQKMVRTRNVRRSGDYVDDVRVSNLKLNESFTNIISDLNERFRLAQYRLRYHNGLLQMSDDALIGVQIEKPFWALVGNPPWENIDRQMKEAIDCRDTGNRMAAFHAVSALESCLKVISDTKGWTTGTERGAAAFVNNLKSKKNGGFLEIWEGDILTKLFSDIRNPFAHGAGQAAMPELTIEQTNWTIETSMSWIKALIRRA